MIRLSRFALGVALSALPLVSALVALSPVSLANASNNTSVYVGYVDGLRGGLQQPAPWEGSPNVIYEGCSPSASCTLDGGAVRFSNNSGAAVTVDYITVNVGGCVFDIWPHGTSVPDSSQLIVAQTAAGAANGCTTDGHFDTSDVGPGGSGYSGNCTEDNVIPTVTISVNGVASTYTDSAQVLNTGGEDQASCSSPGRPQGNEAAQWQLIGGSQVCSSAVLTLAPPQQSQVTGGTATTMATLDNNCGQPLQSNTVDFNITSGPNSGEHGTGVTDANGNASFSYSSAVSGTDTVEASVTTSGGTFTSNDVTVNWDAAITAAAASITGVENQGTGQQTVATFTDPDASAMAGDYTATIDWGDGSGSTSGSISGSSGSFTVAGSHTYAEEGSYPVTVTITDSDLSANTATVTGSAAISDAAIKASCAAPALSSTSFNGPTASLIDAAGTAGSSSDFTALINWGDSSASGGTVGGSVGGPYTVTGSHTYAASGVYTITTSINDDGGSSDSASCTVTVFASPGRGAFVIGDKTAASATSSTPVNWWGSQWSKKNSFSGGSAPASMKGFAASPYSNPPTCGGTFTTDTGNSSSPPVSVPPYMAVIVSSRVSQSGSVITGDIKRIVVVKTDPGYSDNPGHAGTGTIVGSICP